MNSTRAGVPAFEALEPRLLLSSGTWPELSAEATVRPGDANEDGIVDTQDFAALKSNLGQAGGWNEGDFNSDSLVDAEDFTILKAHLGEGTEDSSGSDDYLPGGEVTWRSEELDGGAGLVVLGTDGGDAITVSSSGESTLIIASGESYTIDGAFVSVQVYGFGGDDLLVSISGCAEQLWGGEGFDSFWADCLDTIGDADAAETAAGSVHVVTEFYQPTDDPAEYVSLELAGQDIVDPETGYEYCSFADRPLFADGPEYDDVIQGGISDCYLMASLSSLAQADPGIIGQMIAPMGDGTYGVRFHRGGEEVYLRIDAELPCFFGRVQYANLTPDGELWVALVEKAYAQFRTGENSYVSLRYGWMDPVYAEITGQQAGRESTSSMSSDQLAQHLADNLTAGHAVSAGSYSSTSAPISGSHAYVVRSIENIGGQWYVGLYNPWHQDGFNWDDNPYDGLVVVSLASFQQNFAAVCVSLA
ncbi:MAG: C2 family cysteine protease [Planctomycetota bacterium]|jgi:hypothetical protein